MALAIVAALKFLFAGLGPAEKPTAKLAVPASTQPRQPVAQTWSRRTSGPQRTPAQLPDAINPGNTPAKATRQSGRPPSPPPTAPPLPPPAPEPVPSDDGISGVWKSDVGHVLLLPSGAAVGVRPDLSAEASGIRGMWELAGDQLVITWNRMGSPRDVLTRRGSGWHKGRGGQIGPLMNRRPLSPESVKSTLGFSSGALSRQGLTGANRPVMVYMGGCCESHWEITYVNKCRDGPGCSSAPGVAFDTAGVDMYHPATQCDTPCVLHHDPLLPIDAILGGGFVDRHEYYEEINRMRKRHKAELINEENRPLHASMCLEPYWRTKRRSGSSSEMSRVDVIMSTHLNADIPLTRFSLLRMETNSYDWNDPKMWMHWSQYMDLPGNRAPVFESFDQQYVMSAVIGHCDGPGNYPKGYANRLLYLNALADAGLPLYLTGHMRRCQGRRMKQKFWASSKRELVRKYKFHLALENCDEKDWVTEKIYQTLLAGVVPVYVGADNIADFIPKSAFIRAADFKSPRELTDYLVYVAGNRTAYEEFRAWRINGPNSYEWRHLNWTFETSTASGVCRLCRAINQQRNAKAKSGEKSWGRFWRESVRKGQVWTQTSHNGWQTGGKTVEDRVHPPKP